MALLDGKVVLVTGATDGLGQALAVDLARSGATVLVHGRDPGRMADTVSEVTKVTEAAGATGAADRVRGYRADLASLAAVRALAEQVIAAEPRLDVLVNNAGIGTTVPGGGVRQESADGYELRFAVNYLAGYALTRLLLPLLRKSAPSRIVNVSSLGQQAIDFGDVMLTKGYDGMRAYRQSKLAQILFTVDLAAELELAGVSVNALHPATFMPTKIVAGAPISTIAQGVEATMRLITAPVAETGRYFNGLNEARANDQAYDAEARRQLRELSAKLTGLLKPSAQPTLVRTQHLPRPAKTARRSGDPSETVTVAVRMWNGVVRVEVTDRSGPGVPELARAGRDAEGGRGLQLVADLAARWGWRRCGGLTMTWFELSHG
jgi:NAD(P)-dependent dehydrogenase (short-subunit alcohol dehydrogenase family)